MKLGQYAYGRTIAEIILWNKKFKLELKFVNNFNFEVNSKISEIEYTQHS